MGKNNKNKNKGEIPYPWTDEETRQKLLHSSHPKPYLSTFYPCYGVRLWRHPIWAVKYFIQGVRCFWHRGRYGWCFMDWFNLDNWFYSVLPQLMRDWIANATGYQTYYVDENGDKIEIHEAEEWYRFVLQLADELESIPRDLDNLDYRDLDKYQLDYGKLMEKKRRVFALLAYNIDSFWD